MTFKLSKVWYVQVNMLELTPEVNRSASQETLTADAVENFLRERKFPLLIENGGVFFNASKNAGAKLVSIAAILRDPADNGPSVSDERRAIFYAAAELNVRGLLYKLELKTNCFNTREGQSGSTYTQY